MTGSLLPEMSREFLAQTGGGPDGVEGARRAGGRWAVFVYGGVSDCVACDLRYWRLANLVDGSGHDGCQDAV